MIIELFISALFVAALLLFIKYYALSSSKRHFINFSLKKSDSALLVVSHPDDECLFFSPTLLYLKKKQIRVFVICLSTGNFYGLAKERVKELLNSCKNLGIDEQDVFCLDEFQDDPNQFWSVEEIANVVKHYINKVSAKAVFTFDDSGISGHLNHIATCSGLRHLHSKDCLNQDVKFYLLNTVCLFRKYIQVLDIFVSIFYSFWRKSSVLIVSSPFDYVTAYRSMLCHRSQLVWFRYLMILFSRYMIMNTWTLLPKSTEQHFKTE